jgi:hypothetical protein
MPPRIQVLTKDAIQTLPKSIIHAPLNGNTNVKLPITSESDEWEQIGDFQINIDTVTKQ